MAAVRVGTKKPCVPWWVENHKAGNTRAQNISTIGLYGRGWEKDPGAATQGPSATFLARNYWIEPTMVISSSSRLVQGSSFWNFQPRRQSLIHHDMTYLPYLAKSRSGISLHSSSTAPGELPCEILFDICKYFSSVEL